MKSNWPVCSFMHYTFLKKYSSFISNLTKDETCVCNSSSRIFSALQFWCYPKPHCQTQGNLGFSFMWPSTSFILLYFISKIIMIHFELIFVKVCISVYWFCFNIFNLRKCLKLLLNIPISQRNINATSILQLFHDNFMIFPCHIFLFLLELQQNIQKATLFTYYVILKYFCTSFSS